MNYSTIRNFDISNGLGVRCSIFFHGCTHHCPNCFNRELWDFNGGKPFDEKAKEELFKCLGNGHINGRLSILGGEPLQQNHEEMVALLMEVRERFPNANIWLWTGYRLSDLNAQQRDIISLCDIVVDGRFIEAQKDVSLRFRGSRNQVIWENREGEFVRSNLND